MTSPTPSEPLTTLTNIGMVTERTNIVQAEINLSFSFVTTIVFADNTVRRALDRFLSALDVPLESEPRIDVVLTATNRVRYTNTEPF